MTHSCSTVEFSDVELANALDFVDTSLNIYEGCPGQRTGVRGLRALGSLVSPEINIEPRVINPDVTATVFYPTKKREAIVCIVKTKTREGRATPVRPCRPSADSC
jgi:hypothetical protein